MKAPQKAARSKKEWSYTMISLDMQNVARPPRKT